jgi:hypothetical protein
MNKREQIENEYLGGDQLLFLDPEYFDEAIIGVAQRAGGLFAVAYSEPKIIALLIKHQQMSPDDALEYYQFNILGAYMGEETPVFIDEGMLK